MSNILDLAKSPFFLHSFLDEYIGEEIGNSILDTISEFNKYLKSPYQIKFIDASGEAVEIKNLLLEYEKFKPIVISQEKIESEQKVGEYGLKDSSGQYKFYYKPGFPPSDDEIKKGITFKYEIPTPLIGPGAFRASIVAKKQAAAAAEAKKKQKKMQKQKSNLMRRW